MWTYWSDAKGSSDMDVMLWIVEVDKLDDQVETWGEGVAPEKVSLSDWYPGGTKGPPYNNDSGEMVNIDESVGWLPRGISDMVHFSE